MHQKSSQKEIFGQKFTRKKEHSYISIIFTAKRCLLLSKRQRELDLQITKPRPDHQQQQLLCCREGMHFSLAFVPSLVLERSFFKYNQVQIMLSYTTIRLISHHPRVFVWPLRVYILVFWSGVFMGPKKGGLEGSAMVFKKSEHPGESPCEFVRETLSTIYQGKVIWDFPPKHPKQCTVFFWQIIQNYHSHFV